MGTCFSSAPIVTVIDDPTAKIICANGSLIEYSVPTSVSRIIGSLGDLISSNFLCNADTLCYGTHISALHPDELIELGQLYFMLSVDKLEHVLSASDMLALALMANRALKKENDIDKSRPENSIRVIMPVAEVDGSNCNNNIEYMRLNEDSVGISNISIHSRSVTGKKLAKTSNPSWPKKVHRKKLSTIKEVAE